jgi:diguanylate cyclase (GGDEF)-like protein
MDEAVDGIEEPVAHAMRLRFSDPATERRYLTTMQTQGRAANRVIVCILTILVDLFLLPELYHVSEIVKLSIILRFAILTPLTILFVIFDIKNGLSRFYGAALTALCLLPTVLVAMEIVNTKSIEALPNIQAVPLILLVVMAARLSVMQAAFVVLMSCFFYIAAILNCPLVPESFLPSMILTSLSIGVGVMAFSVRIEMRERAVFVFQSRARQRNQLLAKLVKTDGLTRVANRRSFDESLEWSWSDAWSRQTSLGLIMIDVDHFKAFNDRYGHQKGDICLRQVAHAIEESVRSGDIVARYGGEEFAVILTGASLAQVQNVAERIVQGVRALKLPHRSVGENATVSVSLGAVSMIPREADGSHRLVEVADRLLYRAKETGRDRIECARL